MTYRDTVVRVHRERYGFFMALSGSWGNMPYNFNVPEARAVVQALSRALADYDAEEAALTREYGPRVSEFGIDPPPRAWATPPDGDRP